MDRHMHKSPSSASSPIPANLRHHSHRRRRCCQNVRREPNFAMPLRDLPLRRMTATSYHFRFNHPAKSICTTSINHRAMAEESKNKVSVQEKADPGAANVAESVEEKDNKAPEESAPAIPPPPEKPLPGDCCGSGCVRCVWDVYYEELEEYDRLYKSGPKIS